MRATDSDNEDDNENSVRLARSRIVSSYIVENPRINVFGRSATVDLSTGLVFGQNSFWEIVAESY